MPLIINLLENEVLGPPYRRGLEEGEAKGREEGRQQGERTVLRRRIVKRFGALPAWAEERLNGMTLPELEQLSERVLDATSLDELLH
jgi:hypothetical protein